MMGLLGRNTYQSGLDLGDDLTGTPTPTFWTRWFGGVLLPAGIAVYSARCMILEEAVFIGRNCSQELSGRTAVVFGVAWLFAALFLHFHYFWSGIKWLWVLSEPGKAVSAAGFIGCFGYVVWVTFIR